MIPQTRSVLRSSRAIPAAALGTVPGSRWRGWDVPVPDLESNVMAGRLLAGFHSAIIVVAQDETILFRNQAARRLLARREDVLIGSLGNLCFVSREAAEWFHALLRTSPHACRRADAMLLLGRRAHRHLVSVRPLDANGEADEPCFVVTVANAVQRPPEDGVCQLMRLFGLTPAEQRLAQHLASGRRLSDAAIDFGVSRHTVGNQLRSVFEKTGVKRQVDLLRLIWRSSVPNA